MLKHFLKSFVNSRIHLVHMSTRVQLRTKAIKKKPTILHFLLLSQASQFNEELVFSEVT